MKFVHYQYEESPHVIPFVRAVAEKLGQDEVRYVCSGSLQADRVAMGWAVERPEWLIDESSQPEESRRWVENCPMMWCGLRDMDLFERRMDKNLRTVYSSERWFKPRDLKVGGIRLFRLPWWVKLLSPHYLKMARRIRRLLKSNRGFYYGAVGVHAAVDMARLVFLLSGDLRCLFSAPKLDFERRPLGRVFDAKGQVVPWMVLTGYFVEPSTLETLPCRQISNIEPQTSRILRVLWMGRMIDWKRVDTLVKAVGLANQSADHPIALTLVGDGPEKVRLQRLARTQVAFYPPVSISRVRQIMHEHDVYVLASDGGEGWGAVVNEALEEEMCVLGTYEAGASATMLPTANLFHAGDYKSLAFHLQTLSCQFHVRSRDAQSSNIKHQTSNGEHLVPCPIRITLIGDWSADNAAKALMAFLRDEAK